MGGAFGALPGRRAGRGTRFREVAKARVDGTTGEVTAIRLAGERPMLQRFPAANRGQQGADLPHTEQRKPVIAYQHPLSVYEDLFMGAAA
jgi:hypothetical protein